MKPRRANDGEMSPEERAQFHRKLELWAYGGRKPKRPMLVCADGQIVRDGEGKSIRSELEAWRQGHKDHAGRKMKPTLIC